MQSIMKISLMGYGKMGQFIGEIAEARGHHIASKITVEDRLTPQMIDGTVCIDFTAPQAFINNYKFIADHCRAAIIGTTGWDHIKPEVLAYFQSRNKPIIYGGNFSIGANVFFETINITSKMLAKFGYDPYLLELHHREKKDAPSGTASTIKGIMQPNFPQEIVPACIRSGWIKGVHEVGYESTIDKIVLRHEAYSREGFATGAVLAAEWSNEVQGAWDFRELFLLKLRNEKL